METKESEEGRMWADCGRTVAIVRMVGGMCWQSTLSFFHCFAAEDYFIPLSPKALWEGLFPNAREVTNQPPNFTLAPLPPFSLRILPSDSSFLPSFFQQSTITQMYTHSYMYIATTIAHTLLPPSLKMLHRHHQPTLLLLLWA